MYMYMCGCMGCPISHWKLKETQQLVELIESTGVAAIGVHGR